MGELVGLLISSLALSLSSSGIETAIEGGREWCPVRSTEDGKWIVG